MSLCCSYAYHSFFFPIIIKIQCPENSLIYRLRNNINTTNSRSQTNAKRLRNFSMRKRIALFLCNHEMNITNNMTFYVYKLFYGLLLFAYQYRRVPFYINYDGKLKNVFLEYRIARENIKPQQFTTTVCSSKENMITRIENDFVLVTRKFRLRVRFRQ